MQYVDKVRNYQQQGSLEQAVERAVDESIEEGILRDFLLQNKAEVIKMSIYEFDEEKYAKMLYAEAYEDGENVGMEKGIEKGENIGIIKNLITLTCRKLKKGKSPETIADELEEDFDTIKDICDVAEKFAPNYNVEAICNEMQKAIMN